jgi:gamma-glutamyltranspeptidase
MRVGAGSWLPGFDTQLNNLFGESDIASGDPQPGDHLESRMAPSLVFDANGLELAIGSAGATRLRTALAMVLAAILDEGSTPRQPWASPRSPDRRRRRRRARCRRGALTTLEESGRLFAVGIAFTITLVASAASGAPAQPVTRAGAARRVL